MNEMLSARELKALKAFDTPTICNALEVVAPKRRLYGYTTEPLRCVYPDLEPIVGYARTGTIRATQPSGRDPDADRDVRVGWYRYVDEGPKPSIVVLQDLDGARAGYGCFWGEVNSHVHRGLGALGVVTNGSIRDVPMNARGFQMLAGSVMPSHAHVHVVSIGGDVTVAGMAVSSGDLVHADQHGAVVIPHDVAREIAGAAKLLARREAVIIGASRRKGFDWRVLQDALSKAADIH
ncbi:MAG: RraA family protein [Burkholderiaceae bacterium]